ncbi:MAG: hypothetical protein DPW09_20665 [Anaerolineae bacterium]|nr:hypothetical protein [Anaerolineales bacterium]MCQ3975856.1 hypothetical protein [Anaerolineae bacterium]
MEHVTITLSGEGVQDTQDLNIQVSIAAIINVTAKAARRQATAWLASEVGNMLIGGVPQLVISQRVIWRVPALLTSSKLGPVGEVGAVEVDADTAELLVTPELRARILDNVQQLTYSASSSVS